MAKYPATAPMVICIALIPMFAAVAAAVAAKSGTATFYTSPYSPSSCFGDQDKGLDVAMASNALQKNGAACGALYLVTCTGAVDQGEGVAANPCKGISVIVTIVDYYSSADCQATLSLSEESFFNIANREAGEMISISYHPM